VLLHAGESCRQENSRRIREKMEKRLSLCQCPGNHLRNQLPEAGPGEEVCEFRRRRGHAAHNLIAADPREQDAIPLRRDACCKQRARFGGKGKGAGGRCE